MIPASSSRTAPASRVSLLYFCFFISGIAGLSYEVIWSKYLTLYVGSTGLAQVIVLATFMGGLAIGSQLFGSLADRVPGPLKLYAYLELGVGAYALLFERIFVLGRDVFIALARSDEPNSTGLLVGKILSCVLSILLPTILMGGTMPAMARHLVRNENAVGPTISRLYFLNSIGAVAGCLLAGFVTIRLFGLQFTMVAGATLNIIAGLVAFAVTRNAEAPVVEADAAPAPAEQPSSAAVPGWVFGALLCCVSVSGAISMMYEVAWIRLLALVLGASTYAFSLMLATFILGLSLGGLLLSMKKTPGGYAEIFGLSSVGVGITVLLALPFYERLPYIFNQIAASLNREPATFALYELCQFILCAMVMIVPTFLQGITLPAATKALTSDVRLLGGRVGLIFAVNTLGTLAGSVFAGFFGLPHIGLKATLEVAVALNGVLGLLALFVARPGRGRNVALIAAAVALALVWTWYGTSMRHWNYRVLAHGAYRDRGRIASFKAFLDSAAQRHMLFYRDGIDATIAVQESKDGSERFLTINGKTDASLVGDLGTQKFMGHIPMLIHPAPKRVLVIGLGTGATVGSVLSHDVERVDVVEISKDVIEASRLFSEINAKFWDDPRVHVYAEDAKTFFQVIDRTYDVIVSEPSNPWVAGIAGVFSQEYFADCRQHLAPGGLFLQWVQAYETEDTAFFMILETLTSVFPYYTMWSAQSVDVLIVGSADPYQADFARMDARVHEPAVQADIKRMGVDTLLPILSFQMRNCSDKPSQVRWTGSIHSDYFPLLEYIAPRGFYTGATATGAKWLDGRSRSPLVSTLWITDYLKHYNPTREELGQLYGYLMRYGSLYDRAGFTWAREWFERYPDDTSARASYAAQVGSTFKESLDYILQGDTQIDRLDYPIQKLRCDRMYSDYMARRTYLRDAKAGDVLAAVAWVTDHFPADVDGDLLRMRGQLEFDLGMYREAADTLRAAVAKLRTLYRSRERQIQCGILLCRALLHAHDREAAEIAYKEVLLPYEGTDLNVVLVRSLIRDGGIL